MTEIEKIAYAKGFLDKLADGINPLTGNEVPENELIRQPRISKCMSYVSDILRLVIENGGVQTRDRGLPFVPVSLEKFAYSDTPITVSELARRINMHKQNLNMENFTYFWLQEYLIEKGYLTVVPKDEKSTQKSVTELGKTIGISGEERMDKQNRPYSLLLYSRDAQQFVIRHLDEILAYKAERLNRGQR